MAAPILFNAVALWPEVSVPTPNVNDDAEHAAFVVRASDAVTAGENVIDHWLPQIDLGFAEFFYYQHAPHIAVVALHRALLGVAAPFVVFNLVRWLLLVGLPLTVFWSMRRMGFGHVAALVAAAASSLLSADHRYGFEYDSYVWRGLGLYTQIWAMHLTFIGLALLHGLLTTGRGLVRTIAVLALLLLSHLIYAYMMAITTVVVLAITLRRETIASQLGRLATVGAAVLALTSYMWVPFITQIGYLSTSPYLQPEKYTSYGAPTVLRWFASGELFDHGRLPVFTLLLLGGAIASLHARRRQGLMVVALLLVWLWFYSGRAAIGPLYAMLPLHDSLLFHRFIGGVDLAGIILIGVGGEAVWHLLEQPRLQALIARVPRSRELAVAVGIAAIFLPSGIERWSYYSAQTTWMTQTQAVIDGDGDLATILATLRQLPPGRVYAGLASNWGRTLDFGLPFNSVHVYQLLTAEGFATIAPPFGGQSLNSDLQFDFDDQRASQYDLYNARYVIASPAVSLPSFLVPQAVTPKYVLYEAPTSGYAELVSLAGTQSFRTQAELFPRMRAFVNGSGPDARAYLRFDYPAPTGQADSTGIGGCAGVGTITNETVRPAQLGFDTTCAMGSPVVIKVSYHPDWVVGVDGAPVATFMASPSYIGFILPPGSHHVVAEYRSAPIKGPLLLLGAATAAGLVTLRRRSIAAGAHAAARARLGRLRPTIRLPKTAPTWWPIVSIIGVGVALRLALNDLANFSPADETVYLNYAKAIAAGRAGYEGVVRFVIDTPSAWQFPSPSRWSAFALDGVACRLSNPCDYHSLAVVSTLAGVALLPVVYTVGRRLLSPAVALVGTAFVVTSPLLLGLGRRALQDEFFVLTVWLALWAVVRLLDRTPRTLDYALAVVALGLALGAKDSFVLFYGAFGLMVLLWPGRRFRWLDVSLVVGPPLVWMLGFVLVAGGPGDLLALERISLLGRGSPGAYELAYGSGPPYQPIIDFMVLSPIITLIAIAGVGAIVVGGSLGARRLALVTVVSLIGFGLLLKDIRYAAAVAPMLALIAAWAIAERLRPAGRVQLPGIVALVSANAALEGWIFWTVFIAGGVYDPMLANLLRALHAVP